MPRDVVPIFRFTPSRLGQQVQIAMVREDQVSLVANHDPVVDIHALVDEFIDFCEKGLGIHDHAIANHARDTGVKDARGDEAQNELGATDINSMSGIVPTLIARDDVEAWRQEIDDFPLAFVAPLGAQHRQIHVPSILLSSWLGQTAAGGPRSCNIVASGFCRDGKPQSRTSQAKNFSFSN